MSKTADKKIFADNKILIKLLSEKKNIKHWYISRTRL